MNVSANLSAARMSQAVKKAGNPLGWADSSQATADRTTVNETNIGHFGVQTAGLHSRPAEVVYSVDIVPLTTVICQHRYLHQDIAAPGGLSGL
jgi:hypothetical protein